MKCNKYVVASGIQLHKNFKNHKEQVREIIMLVRVGNVDSQSFEKGNKTESNIFSLTNSKTTGVNFPRRKRHDSSSKKSKRDETATESIDLIYC